MKQTGYESVVNSFLIVALCFGDFSREDARFQAVLRKMEQGKEQGKNMVTICERMIAKTVFSVDGVEAAVDPVEPPVEVTSDGKENLIVKTIKESSG